MDNFVREEFADFGHDQDDILHDEQEVIFDTDDSDCEISTDDENQQGSENEDNIQIPATDHNFRRIYDISSNEIRDLEFDTQHEACKFFQTYARCKGFVARKHNLARDRNNNITMQQLVCNRAGLRQKKYLEKVDRKKPHAPITRTNCKAKFRVRLDRKKSKWIVSSFVEEHNHFLTPSTYVHLFPAYRALNDADKAQIDMLHMQGVRTCHIMGYMLAQKGGYSGLGFSKKDLYNYLDRQKRFKIQDGDARAALSYIQGKADNDPIMFCKYSTTNDGKLKHLFWADGQSIVDFQCFGDVLAFDTTYKKNKYNYPLVIFSGCNHHSQTIIFGCALVSDETFETYKWVLETFLEAMHKKHPISVVTDGDVAMREAIKLVFPDSTHRLCAWHLNKNACENVKNSPFLDDFKKAMYSNFTPEEFEDFWQQIIVEHGVEGNTWVLKTYDNKLLWATAYLRDTFFGRIRTTSQCEAINSLIRSYVRKKNTLYEFIHNFEQLLREYRNNELIADFKSNFSEPVMTSSLKHLERQAANIYTLEMFTEVRKEIELGCALNVVGRIENGDELTLHLSKYGHPESLVKVDFDRSNSKFSCACRLYEARGIPCSHIICVLKNENIQDFPSSLICGRWTKTSKTDLISAMSSDEVDVDVMIFARFGALAASCNRLCKIASKKTEYFDEVRDEILRLTHKLEKLGDQGTSHASFVEDIGDPTVVKTKGAPTKKKKGGKRRRCSNCNRVGHVITTCPRIASDHNGTQNDDVISLDDNQRCHGKGVMFECDATDGVGSKDNGGCPNFIVSEKKRSHGKQIKKCESSKSLSKVHVNERAKQVELNINGTFQKSGILIDQPSSLSSERLTGTMHQYSLVSPTHLLQANSPQSFNYWVPSTNPYGASLLHPNIPLIPQMVQYPQFTEVSQVPNDGGGTSWKALLEGVIKNGSQTSGTHGHLP
ncbi:unnamed protein product [Cuscuta epithymum]|uniref:SWIM-type domain-containing protein n=1 Tax=Cuscuta epithymum TaxID=186058 RepID=A0AAV0DDR5_9ASTE|nr:unnamed protein product [Cuscuta epithymum]